MNKAKLKKGQYDPAKKYEETKGMCKTYNSRKTLQHFAQDTVK